MRRVLSVILYVIAGLCLGGEMMMAFFDPSAIEGGSWAAKLGMMGIMGGLALVPLALGLLASPGRRRRELGIVLVTTAIITAAEFAIVVFMMVMPDTGKLFPPGLLQPLSDVPAGLLNLMLVGGAGWWLVRRFSAKADI